MCVAIWGELEAHDMADGFVSYARIDKARVAPLVAAIEAAGWSVWWDPAIEPGQEFHRQIAAELANATAVLVVWTPTSVESRWVRGEAREADDHGKIVPARFDGATLPIDFRALHTIDIDHWVQDARNRAAQELLRAIGAVVERQRASKTTFGTRRSMPTIRPSRSCKHHSTSLQRPERSGRLVFPLASRVDRVSRKPALRGTGKADELHGVLGKARAARWLRLARRPADRTLTEFVENRDA